jgi:tetratricopeptide (TPR) repeat protein
MPRIRRRWFVWALPALLLVGGAGYASWRTLWADGHLREARAALDHHNYLKAREHCDAYLQVWPNSAEVHLLAARCARHLGAFDDAEQHLTAARKSNGDSSVLTLEAALLDVQSGQGGRSDEQYLRALVEQDRPETSEIFETLTQACLFHYRIDDALETANQWIAHRPSDSQAFYLRGLVWEAMQNLEKAREDYGRAVALDARNIEAGKRLAEVQLTQGDADEALQQFTRLRELAPDDPALQLGAARCHRLLGHTDEARRMLDALAPRQPDNAAVWNTRGSVAMDQDRLADAEESFRKALALDPFDDVTYSKLAACLRRLGRTAEADEMLEHGKRIEDDAARLRSLTEEIARRPTDPAPRYEAGVICMRNGQEREGLRWLLGALQSNPRHGPAHAALADYYESIGKPEQAAEHRRFVNQDGPRD